MPQGIVLTRIPFREYDEVISLITREYGRVDVIAKGIKKITSKLSAHLEPFSLVSFDLVQGKELVILTTASTVHVFSGIRSDFIKRLEAEYAAHALYTLTRPGNLEHGIFDLFFSWLVAYDEAHVVSDGRFLDWFMLHLMGVIGFAPAYIACIGCGSSHLLSFWSFSGGGVVCGACTTRYPDAGSLIRISPETIHDLSRLSAIDIQSLSQSSACVPAVHHLLVGHIQYQADTKIGDWAYTCVEV